MTARIKDSDIEHLSWIYDRLANVHSENTNFDYMHKLNAIIANLKLDYAYYGDLVLHREEVRPVGELIETPEEKEALDAVEQVEWNGEGLPPVGFECEFKEESPSGLSVFGRWTKCTVLAYNKAQKPSDELQIIIRDFRGDAAIIYSCDEPLFRKLEIPEEKEALDEKTYRYEKVEFGEDWEYFKLMSEDGDLYVNCVDSTFEGCYGDNINLANAIHEGVDLYRRIEVTERELFIDAYASELGLHIEMAEAAAGKLYDSGKFKLVNGKG